jgi:flagellar biosynthesis anti-sigma factor FlgM
MNMRINETSHQMPAAENLQGTVAGKIKEDRKSKTAEIETGKETDTKVVLSEESLEFRKVEELMEKESPERARRVKELKKEINSGDYRVDASKIAAKIIEDALDS